MSNLEDVVNSEELNIIKRIANQLAQPSYAGYPTCVNKKEYDVSLKSVPTEQIEVLLDEYSTEFGGRLTNVIEEMKSVENILLDELFFGESGILFSVIGEIGIGKTSLLLHLNWRINYLNEYIYKLFIDQDDTWSYWNLHNNPDGNPLSINRYGNRTWVWDNDFVPCTPKRIIGVYVQAIDLLPFLRENQDIIDIKDIIEASYTTYVHRDTTIDSSHVSHSDYVSAYTSIIQKDNPTAVFLFIDSLDLIQDRNARVSLIQQLNETVQDHSSNVFRVFFSSRNYALFKMKDIPENTIFLYLEKLDEERAIKLCYNISPNLDECMKSPLQKKIFKRIMRHCNSPYIALLTTKLIEEGVSLPPSLFSFYELILNKLESKSSNEHSLNTSKNQIGISKVSPGQFNDLVGLVAYFSLCWLPMSWDQKWSTKEKFQKVISTLLKKYPISFNKTSIGFIYKDYLNHHKDSGFTDKQISDLVAKTIWNSIASHFIDTHLARLHFKQSSDSTITVEDEDVNDIQILDLPLLQFLVASFLTQSPLSEPLLNSINSLEETSSDVSNLYPNLFSWRRESILTDHCWENVYDLICSKKGISFTSELILQHKQTMVDFLNNFKASKGIDPEDLGQIRFYRFIKGFALEIEDQQLYNLMYPKSRKQNLFIDSLQDLFGRSLVTAIEYNSTAIIHLEKRTTFILETFSKSALKLLIKIMVDILFKGTMASITELLQRMDSINLIDESIISKIVDFVGNPKEGAILKPAVRFLSSRAQNYRHVRVFVENLAIKDHEILEESISAISKIAKQSLTEVLIDFQKQFYDLNIYEEMEDNELIPYYRVKDQPSRRIHFIYNYHDWNLLFRTAVSILMDLIRLGFLHSMKNLSYYEKSYEPKARLIQCKKVSTFIKMMESSNPGTRLFAFILLGSIDRSNMYDKESENKNIDSQIIISNSLTEAYKPRKKLTSELGIKGLNYIILDLLGEEAMYYSIKLDSLIKSKHDLLCALNKWAFSLINVEKKRNICHSLLQHRNYRVQRDIIHFMANDKMYLIDANQADLSAIITHGLIKRDPRLSIQKLSLQFLDASLKNSNNQSYRIHCIEQIMSLFSRFGYFEANISETLLKTIDSFLSGSDIKEDEKNEIISILKKKEFHTKIIKSFRSQGSNVNKIYIGKIYRHFVKNDDPSILDYVLILADIPNLRYLALEQLKYIDISLGPALIEMAISQLMRNEDTILKSTFSVLLGNIGFRENLRPLIIDKALELITKYNNDSVCVIQGLKILSIVGFRCKEFPNVSISIESLLKSLEAHILSEQTLTSTEIEFIQGLCECIEKIRLYSDEIIFSLINILNNISDNGIMNSIFLVIANLARLIPHKIKFEDSLFTLLNNPNSLVRELGIRIIRKFGSSTVKHSVSRLVKLISDPEPFPRKQALKSLSFLMKNGDERVRRDALLLVPAIVSALEDKYPMVVIEALEALRAFKSRRRAVIKSFESIRPSSPLLDTDSDSSGQIDPAQITRSISKEGIQLRKSKRYSSNEEEDESTFFINKVVKPNLDRIVAILHRKRYRMHTGVRVTVFLLLCESKNLSNHISHFEELFNSEDTNMLYEIGEVFKKLGQNFLHYIGTVMSILKPGNPLIRYIARIIAKHEKKIDYASSSKIFDTQTIITLAKSKDSNVRRIAVNLLGKKVLEKPKSLWALIQMWSDKVYKVRKEVMEVLGDIGRRNPKIIPMIMDAIDTESMNSVLIWRYLSKSWGILIKSSTSEEDSEDESYSS